MPIPRPATARHLVRTLLVALAALVPATEALSQQGEPAREFAILGLNDVYRIEGLTASQEGGLARVAWLREQLEEDHPDLLVLHAGDLLYPSLMSRMYAGEQMIRTLNVLDRDGRRFDDRMFVAFGNHEFDAGDADDVTTFATRVEQSDFTWLRSGVEFLDRVSYALEGGDRTLVVDGVDARGLPNLRSTALVSAGGVWVGILAITLPVDDVGYVESFVGPALRRREYVRRRTAALRRAGAEFVVAVTHLSLSEDEDLLRALGPAGPDLIVGGHDHEAVIRRAAGRYVAKADADARSVNVVRVRLTDDEFPTVTINTLPLDATVAMNAQVRDTVQAWMGRHDREFCEGQRPPEGPDCLNRRLATVEGLLEAEEIAIRNHPTGFGQWVAETMLDAFTTGSARPDAAVVNSGALRLNQNVADGGGFTRRHLEELVQYDDPLHLIEVSGETVDEMMQLSARCVGSGPWLQFTGITARFDENDRRMADITIGGQPLDEAATYRIVVPDYLAGGGDGYAVLGTPESDRLRTVPSLKGLLVDAMAALPGGVLALREATSLTRADLPGGPAAPCPRP